MKKVFVNFSNHRTKNWDENQISAAEKYGRIVDVDFPMVNPESTEQEIRELGQRCCDQILSYRPNAVMCQGEFTLAYYVVQHLKESGIPVLAACSERCVEEDGGMKASIFKFVRFREYL